ncbi:MAG: hypothetical protein BWY76_03004 [bacterium ADurb.Bin429]|nr:MAG: hypothetical protein BWY76_03004 [bacterium ADurb.Bin429]
MQAMRFPDGIATVIVQYCERFLLRITCKTMLIIFKYST